MGEDKFTSVVKGTYKDEDQSNIDAIWAVFAPPKKTVGSRDFREYMNL